MFEYARVLVAEITKQGSATTFYLTWARQHVPEMQQGGKRRSVVKRPARAMFQLSGAAKDVDFESWCQQHKAGLEGGLNGAYFGIAEQLGAKVAPVGVAWKKALTAEPSLVLHSVDKSHPNPTGTYLAACVFYASLLEQNPVGLPSQLKRGDVVLINIPQEQAERLQTIAWESVNEMAKQLLESLPYRPRGVPHHRGSRGCMPRACHNKAQGQRRSRATLGTLPTNTSIPQRGITKYRHGSRQDSLWHSFRVRVSRSVYLSLPQTRGGVRLRRTDPGL